MSESVKMNTAHLARIDTLNKENYDTWVLQMEALLIKNDAWSYVSGELVKPEDTHANQAAREA